MSAAYLHDLATAAQANRGNALRSSGLKTEHRSRPARIAVTAFGRATAIETDLLEIQAEALRERRNNVPPNRRRAHGSYLSRVEGRRS
jgi:hypothetical protein